MNMNIECSFIIITGEPLSLLECFSQKKTSAQTKFADINSDDQLTEKKSLKTLGKTRQKILPVLGCQNT